VRLNLRPRKYTFPCRVPLGLAATFSRAFYCAKPICHSPFDLSAFVADLRSRLPVALSPSPLLPPHYRRALLHFVFRQVECGYIASVILHFFFLDVWQRGHPPFFNGFFWFSVIFLSVCIFFFGSAPILHRSRFAAVFSLTWWAGF